MLSKRRKIDGHQWLLLLVLVVPGTFCFAVSMYYALIDWTALQKAYAHFAFLATTSKDMTILFVAESKQNIHRINLFADVVWALLGAVVAAIGLHGLCVKNWVKDNNTPKPNLTDG